MLEKIQKPNDIKKIPADQLPASADSRSGARVTAMYSTPATARPRFPQASAMCVHGN